MILKDVVTYTCPNLTWTASVKRPEMTVTIPLFLPPISPFVPVSPSSYTGGCSNVESLIARFMEPIWGHLGQTGPRWAPCWPHELCYLGYPLKHWGRDKMAAILQTMPSNANIRIWIKISLKFVFKGPISNIPARQQAISWSNDG